MSRLTLTEWSLLSQIVLTFITAFGIIISMWLSIKALREVQVDRKLRQKPYLAFEPDVHPIQIEFIAAGKSVPGIDPTLIQKTFPDIADDALSARVKVSPENDAGFNKIPFGHLKNYGLGPALEAEVTWVPTEVWMGSEKFSLDELSEPTYSRTFNNMPAVPSHILPEEDAGLTRLPTFIVLDSAKKISRVEGIIEINCEDVFGQAHKTQQSFYLLTNYKDDSPYVQITFSDLVKAAFN